MPENEPLVRSLTQDEIHEISCGISSDVRAHGEDRAMQMTTPWRQRIMACAIRTINDQQKVIDGLPVLWRVRGIGSEWGLRCIVTGESNDLMPNASGFVSSRSEGERFVAMLGGRATLDYRPTEPDHIQVKIGATAPHVQVLQRLRKASQYMGGWMTASLVKWAIAPEQHPGFAPPMLPRLERAEDGLRDNIETISGLKKIACQMNAIVGRLPRTADDATIIPRTTVWKATSPPRRGIVLSVSATDAQVQWEDSITWHGSGRRDRSKNDDLSCELFSTEAAAAEASREKAQ